MWYRDKKAKNMKNIAGGLGEGTVKHESSRAERSKHLKPFSVFENHETGHIIVRCRATEADQPSKLLFDSLKSSKFEAFVLAFRSLPFHLPPSGSEVEHHQREHVTELVLFSLRSKNSSA